MKNFFKTSISHGAVLIFAMMFANLLNFIYNAYLGRVLSLEDFALLAVVNTLWFLLMVFMNSLATTTNHFVAFYIGNGDTNLVRNFIKRLTSSSLIVSLIISALWLIASPFISSSLSIDDHFAVISILPVITIGTLLALNRGYLQGSFMFVTLAIVVIVEAVSKLLIAYLLVILGYKSIAYLSIPIAVVIAFIAAYIFLLFANKKQTEAYDVKVSSKSPLEFYITSVVNSISSVAFLSVDILLVKHFLASDQAGAYALLSLVGKMIYFLGTLLNGFVISYISRDIGQNKDYKTTFYKIFFISTILTFIGYVSFGLLGHITIPILLGEKANAIIGYINLYGIGIAAFTLSTTVVAFHLSKKNYSLSYIGLITTTAMIIGLSFYHSNVWDVVNVITAVSISHFIVIMMFHLYLIHWKKAPAVEYPVPSLLESLLDKLPVKVSVCLPAYNEAKNIGKLLDKLLVQKTKNIYLNKIIVISSASTDNTDEIVRAYANKDDRVLLLTEDERNGKATAINLFLKHVDDPIVVIQSTDTIPDDHTIENLCRPFLHDELVGMTGGAPIPVNDRNTFLGYIVHTWWWFHRHIPRFGEIIAFRNILPEISATTAVDEAYIQAQFIKLGYKLKHVDEAIVYNKGAERLKDMIKQRRRIHNGHSRLNDEEDVKVTHLTKNALWLLLFKYELNSIKEFIWLVGGIGIEVLAVILAIWDKRVKNINPTVWDIAKSTKNLVSINRSRS